MTHHASTKIILILLLVSISPTLFAGNRGQEIIEEKCTLCHDAPEPAKLTKEEWVASMKIMASSAGLSATEISEVLDYVSSHAKDSKDQKLLSTDGRR